MTARYFTPLEIPALPGETAAHHGVTAGGGHGIVCGHHLVLEAELAAVQRLFAGLSDDQWRLPTKLVPVDPDLPGRVRRQQTPADRLIGRRWSLSGPRAVLTRQHRPGSSP
jgi:hypothetical protein